MASKKDKISKAVSQSIGSTVTDVVRDIQQKNEAATQTTNPPSERESTQSERRQSPKVNEPASVAKDQGSQPEIEVSARVEGPNSKQEASGEENNLLSGETIVQRTDAGRPGMAKSRDSIYNVSSDIRLEDYTEPGGGGNGGKVARIASGAILVAILAAGVYFLSGWIFAPRYTLAISNQTITEANVASVADIDEVNLSSRDPVHIRFDWEAGKLETDYLKIKIDRVETGEDEEAVLGRRPPKTANYIYFYGILDPGKFKVKVLDAGGDVLEEKAFQVN